MFAWEKTPWGLSHPGTTHACTIQNVRRMKCPCNLSHSDFVKHAGGEVLLAKVVPGYSTTATIARLAS